MQLTVIIHKEVYLWLKIWVIIDEKLKIERPFSSWGRNLGGEFADTDSENDSLAEDEIDEQEDIEILKTFTCWWVSGRDINRGA